MPGGCETIIIVEDEEAAREVVHRVLTAKGYTVLRAESARQAETLFRERGSDAALLLTDVVMPERSGPELFMRLAAERTSLKVIYMSGYPQETVVASGMVEQGAPFLQKPFDGETLARKVREVLDA